LLLIYLGKRVRGEDGTACTLREFTITKQLTKDPNKYPNDKGQPHVQVAKKLLEKGVQGSSLINHYIPYVIIKNDKEGLGEKACHPEEFAQKSKTIIFNE
jgi:DNA polymerase elongation subunit (family B)